MRWELIATQVITWGGDLFLAILPSELAVSCGKMLGVNLASETSSSPVRSTTCFKGAKIYLPEGISSESKISPSSEKLGRARPSTVLTGRWL